MEEASTANSETPDLPSYTINVPQLLRNAPYFRRMPYIDSEYPAERIGNIVEVLVESNYGHDFCWGDTFHPKFLAELMRHGFLTMATEPFAGMHVLLPKLHRERCVVEFDKMRVQRGTKKKSKNFDVTCNVCFDEVAKGLSEQHGYTCWFYPALVRGLREIHFNPETFNDDGQPQVRVHSFEVWQGDKLVAGEIGCSVGAVFTSMSGFSRVSGAGSVQLAATGELLKQAGCKLWDLGMVMPYKLEMGGETISRREFLSRVQRFRVDTPLEFSLSTRANAKDIILGPTQQRQVKPAKQKSDGDKPRKADSGGSEMQAKEGTGQVDCQAAIEGSSK